MFISQLLGIFDKEFEDLSIILTGLEGLVGSGPQITLQLVAVLYMRPPGPVQILVFIISILVIGKSVIQYDVLYKEGTTNRDVEISFGRKLKYSIQVFPIYLSSIFFRLGALVLLTGYLRYFAIIPILLHILLVCGIAYMLKFEKKDIFIMACTNTCIMSVGPLKSAKDSKRQSRFKFLFFSSLSSFFMLSAFLVGLVYKINTDIEYMSHWNILLLSRCNDLFLFNIVSYSIFQAGILNLLLLCNSQWGRLDSYLDREDMEDIMNNMRDQYRRGNVSKTSMDKLNLNPLVVCWISSQLLINLHV